MDLLFIITFFIYALGVSYVSLVSQEKRNAVSESYQDPQLFFSVVVVLRDEEKTLPKLFQAIDQQDYPKELFEIILVDDCSEDQSYQLSKDWVEKGQRGKVLRNDLSAHPSPKKAGFLTALSVVESKHILRTDADCWFSDSWLSAWNRFLLENQKYCLAFGPVFSQSKGFFGSWGNMESLVLAFFTRFGALTGKPFMFNAANSYLNRTCFPNNPFEGDFGRISGDDEALLNNMNPEFIGFNSFFEGQVYSAAPGNWSNFVNQKLRWSGKWKLNPVRLESWIPVFLFTFYLIYFSLFLMVFLGNISMLLFIQLLVLKGFADLLLMFQSKLVFRKKFTLFEFVMFESLFGFYTLFIGLLSRFKGFTWKGRIFATDE